MSMTVEEISAEAVALPNGSKADVVHRLMECITADIDPDLERIHLMTPRRRRDEVRTGLVEPVPGEEGLARIRGLVQ